MDLREKSAEWRARAERIRREMGGTDKIERIHADGQWTIRERVEHLLDPGSFFEIGTFARSERPEDRAGTPGDGKLAGLGRIDGRPVAVAGDDVIRLSIGIESAQDIIDDLDQALNRT